MLVYIQMIETPAEKSKFETIYLMYRQCMYQTAFSILKNSQDAEDAVHSAFVKIARSMQKIGKPESYETKGFVVTVVRNTAIDLYRKKQAHPDAQYIETMDSVQETYDGENAVARCIAKLPERQQNVLILRYVYGYDLREIAQMLGVTYKNAAQIEQRAKTKLRLLCEEEGVQC